MVSFLFLEYSCFTMLCSILLYSKANQPYTYIDPLFFGFPSHLGHQRALSRVPCAIQWVLTVCVCVCCLLSRVRLLRPHRLQLARLLCSWNSPAKNTAVGSHFLLQGIFPTQGSNPGLLHCKQTLYRLSHRGSPLCLFYIQNRQCIYVNPNLPTLCAEVRQCVKILEKSLISSLKTLCFFVQAIFILKYVKLKQSEF